MHTNGIQNYVHIHFLKGKQVIVKENMSISFTDYIQKNIYMLQYMQPLKVYMCLTTVWMDVCICVDYCASYLSSHKPLLKYSKVLV